MRRRWQDWRQALPHVLWVTVIVLVVALQWPLLRGVASSAGGPPPPNAIPWRTDLPAALAEAKELNKPVLVDFTADWCPPCRVMLHETWPDDRVEAAVTARVVPVMLDVDRPESAGAVHRYWVEYYPTVLLLDPAGNELRRAGFMTADDLLAFVGGG